MNRVTEIAEPPNPTQMSKRSRVGRRLVPVLVATGFCVGLLAAPAMATSYNTGWHKIFGHSTSCALALGSINDSTRKSGAQTVNRYGCSASNAPVTVPAYRLYAATNLFMPSQGRQCSPTVTDRNTSPDTDVVITSALAVSPYCPLSGSYSGVSAHIRVSDAGDQYSKSLSTVIRQF